MSLLVMHLMMLPPPTQTSSTHPIERKKLLKGIFSTPQEGHTQMGVTSKNTTNAHLMRKRGQGQLTIATEFHRDHVIQKPLKNVQVQ